MDFGYYRLLCLLALWNCGICSKPLHLTPLIDEGNIAAALELSEVKDALQIIPKSHAGFITTDRDRRNHLFFWFFPATSNPVAPLVVWLNGGPGISSMLGLLYENGPIRTKTLDNGEVVYEPRPGSWAEPFSMLYIDNPVGIGYSYSETNSFKTSQEEYSEELYLFIEQFYLMFPQYLHRELYIGGQSYAGKYVPAFAHRIHTRIVERKSVIPLTGIYLGGPYFDPLVQSAEFCEYYYAMGAITHFQLANCKIDVAELGRLIEHGDIEKIDYYSIFSKAFPNFLRSYLDNYVTNNVPGYDDVQAVMGTDEMRGIVNARHLNYTVIRYDARSFFISDFFVGTKQKLADLMDSYKVLIFTGDFDGLISSPMVEAALMTTPWSLQEQYNNSMRSVWKAGTQIKGFYTKTGQFCRVVIRGAGHQVPHDQPDSTLEMMVHFVQHGCILESHYDNNPNVGSKNNRIIYNNGIKDNIRGFIVSFLIVIHPLFL